jgi:lysozyme family protein
LSFERCIKHILKTEGGYVEDPVDQGWATNFGITIMTLARFRGVKVTPEDVKFLKQEEAERIYRRFYWIPASLDKLLLRDKAQLVIFDQVINRGPSKPILQAQIILNKIFGKNIEFDGIMGPQTINTLNEIDEIKFCLKYLQLSILAYDKIVEENPSQIKFLKGWHNRIFSLLDVVNGYERFS